MEYLSGQNSFSQSMNPYFNNANVLGTLTVNILTLNDLTVKNLTVQELATIVDATVSGTLTVAGKQVIGTVLSDTEVLTVNGLAIINNLFVNQATSLNDVAISGTLSLASLTINGPLTVTGLTTTSTIQPVNIFAQLNIDAQTFNSTGLATFNSLQITNNATIATNNTISTTGYNTSGSYFRNGLNLFRYIKTEIYGATVWTGNAVSFNGGPDYTNPIKTWYYPGSNSYYSPTSFNLAYNLYNAGPFYYAIYNLSVTPVPTLLAFSAEVGPTTGFNNLPASIVATMPTDPCILGVALYLANSLFYAQFYGLSVGYSQY